MIAFAGNDNLVRFSGAKAVLLSTAVAEYLGASATVQFRVQTREYVDVPGETWPIAMTYITGSTGNFLGVLRDTVTLEADMDYRFIATVDAGPNQRAQFDMPLHVLTRQE